MTRCLACKKEIPDGTTSCPACGESLTVLTDESLPPQRGSAGRDPALDDSADRTRLFADTPGKTKRGLTSTFPSRRQSRPSSFESIDDSRFVPGTILAERYRIIGLIGSGGMGEVYRADDLKLSQPVALKFLPTQFLSDGAALARFH